MRHHRCPRNVWAHCDFRSLGTIALIGAAQSGHFNWQRALYLPLPPLLLFRRVGDVLTSIAEGTRVVDL